MLPLEPVQLRLVEPVVLLQGPGRLLVARHATGHPQLPGLGQRLLQLLVHRSGGAFELFPDALQFLLVMRLRPLQAGVVQAPRLSERVGNGGGELSGLPDGEVAQNQDNDQAAHRAQTRFLVSRRIEAELLQDQRNLAQAPAAPRPAGT